MKFDASTAPEALDYDFTPWGGTAGPIPEPTDVVLQTFLKFYDDVTEETSEESLQAEANSYARGGPPVQIIGDLPELPDYKPVRQEPAPKKSLYEVIIGDPDQMQRTVDAIGDLCQQSPSAEQIWALPHRVRSGFCNWVSNILLFGSPEGYRPAGTSGSPAGQNGDGDITSPAAS